MAKMSDLKLEVDKYFIQTRVYLCLNVDCINFNRFVAESAAENCNLKQIDINKEGKCDQFRKIE